MDLDNIENLNEEQVLDMYNDVMEKSYKIADAHDACKYGDGSTCYNGK